MNAPSAPAPAERKAVSLVRLRAMLAGEVPAAEGPCERPTGGHKRRSLLGGACPGAAGGTEQQVDELG